MIKFENLTVVIAGLVERWSCIFYCNAQESNTENVIQQLGHECNDAELRSFLKRGVHRVAIFF